MQLKSADVARLHEVIAAPRERFWGKRRLSPQVSWNLDDISIYTKGVIITRQPNECHDATCFAPFFQNFDKMTAKSLLNGLITSHQPAVASNSRWIL